MKSSSLKARKQVKRIEKGEITVGHSGLMLVTQKNLKQVLGDWEDLNTRGRDQ